MKITIVENCYGKDYDFKVGDQPNVKKDIAQVLIAFGYAVEGETEVKNPKKNPDGKKDEEQEEPEQNNSGDGAEE